MAAMHKLPKFTKKRSSVADFGIGFIENGLAAETSLRNTPTNKILVSSNEALGLRGSTYFIIDVCYLNMVPLTSNIFASSGVLRTASICPQAVSCWFCSPWIRLTRFCLSLSTSPITSASFFRNL